MFKKTKTRRTIRKAMDRTIYKLNETNHLGFMMIVSGQTNGAEAVIQRIYKLQRTSRLLKNRLKGMK